MGAMINPRRTRSWLLACNTRMERAAVTATTTAAESARRPCPPGWVSALKAVNSRIGYCHTSDSAEAAGLLDPGVGCVPAHAVESVSTRPRDLYALVPLWR